MFESIKKICKKGINRKGGRNVQTFGGCCSCGGGAKRPDNTFQRIGGTKRNGNVCQSVHGAQRITGVCQMTNMLRRIGK